jgi:hypothetical protein
MATLVGRRLTGDLQATEPGYLLLINLVRLSDKAVHEYEQMRLTCEDFAANARHGKFGGYYTAPNHAETCISALHRAILYANGARREKGLPTIDKNRLPREFEVRELRSLRDMIQHTDQEITGGNIHLGDPPFLAFSETQISLGSSSITFSTLAKWLRQIDAVAADVLELMH